MAEHPAAARARFGAARAVALLLIVLAEGLLPSSALAVLDLKSARVERLENGLTVISLPDRTFPVVSVQMLYRAGAKHEPAGATGLAHFLEHMAFRDSVNFPDTGVVSAIYAAGGEWHGYTWLDQTTYFATAPRAELELLLRIEADRMSRLLIPAAKVEAERGAILAEMHGYENDPSTVLHDYLLYQSFLAHPYRNNTIGWESDIEAISHEQLVDFYESHYHAGNAVLAVVGDIDHDELMRLVRRHFAALQGAEPSPDPHTREPEQTGERRLRLHGAVADKHFKMAYRAPAVGHPDYPGFLLLQDLLAAGSGVSFLQNDWGTPARPGAPLDGITADLTTWFPPSKQDYVFTISGSVAAADQGSEQADAKAAEKAIERGIDAGIERLHRDLLAAGAAARVEEARERVRRELAFDVRTTEDAAHQLAFFAGLDALDVLLGLPAALDRVAAEDLLRLIKHYLAHERRSVAWYLPANPPSGVAGAHDVAAAPASSAQAKAASGRSASQAEAHIEPAAAGEPRLATLSGGMPVAVQDSPLSRTVLIKAVLPGRWAASPKSLPGTLRRNQPSHGLSSFEAEFLSDELPDAFEAFDSMLGHLQSAARRSSAAEAAEPVARLEAYFEELLGLESAAAGSPPDTAVPLLLVVSGDVREAQALAGLEAVFGGQAPTRLPRPAELQAASSLDIESSSAWPLAQEQLGYVVAAPGPRDSEAPAWQILAYIMSHGYEGRLGKEAISRRGLVYYIDSAYRSDGRNGWITLITGVDPAKTDQMKALLRAELNRLVHEPPSAAELKEARRHLLGRWLSAAQSNRELADRLARDWAWYGELQDYDTLQRRLENVSRAELKAAAQAFASGSVVAIRNSRKDPGN